MSSKDPNRLTRKRNLFRLIDSYVPVNIDLALQLMQGDHGLYQAVKQRYYPIMRLVDPHLGQGFQLLHKVATNLQGEPDSEFLERLLGCYALLGEREFVVNLVQRHPIAVRHMRSVALLNMLSTMDLPSTAAVESLELKAGEKPLQLSENWRAWMGCQKLVCTENVHFRGLEPHLPEFTALKTMDLSGCGIASLSPALASIRQLEACHLNQNQLEEVPGFLRENASLRRLEMNDNRLQALPDWLAAMPNLGIVEAKGNRIDKVDAWLWSIPNLWLLRLDGNRLTQLPGLPDGATPQTQFLYLSHNPLGHFPETICALPILHRLVMNHTQITTLPTAVGQMRALRRLSLNNNPLARFPEALCALAELEELHLCACPFEALPEAIGAMQQLQELDLRGTPVMHFPESMRALTQLRQLHLARASAGSLPQLKEWLPQCWISVY